MHRQLRRFRVSPVDCIAVIGDGSIETLILSLFVLMITIEGSFTHEPHYPTNGTVHQAFVDVFNEHNLSAFLQDDEFRSHAVLQELAALHFVNNGTTVARLKNVFLALQLCEALIVGPVDFIAGREQLSSLDRIFEFEFPIEVAESLN
ncbi:hypothetical protein M433DRAFT_335439 [Acidomyces richmondensis BFW]|nr:hypothetical protein M433DRAFT_335439 [Acidomyces richmondensis BFW]